MFNLKDKLQKTRDNLVNPLKKIFQRGEGLSEDESFEVEELLLGADVGVEACDKIMEMLRETGAGADYREALRDQFLDLLRSPDNEHGADWSGTRAVIVIGVNGVGKTTSIAKLAHYYKSRGQSVILAACDTFRAAASDQLGVWADRVGVEMVRHKEGGDPGAVAFDACNAARARGADVVIVDTAGRLHTKVNLLEELKKIKRVTEKVLGSESVETLLVLDATLGQNSLVQAVEFTRALTTDGIILTKLDSTAKGGIVVAIKQTLGIPVRFIGVGEQIDDFGAFTAEEFVDALLG
ncbi:MAG: signal recognition particle-docking protein FtsY [Candidatus Latescibacterota bacterium]|jgi:fused signal recognition particle receptor